MPGGVTLRQVAEIDTVEWVGDAGSHGAAYDGEFREDWVLCEHFPIAFVRGASSLVGFFWRKGI